MKHLLLFFASTVFSSLITFAQNPSLVADINATGDAPVIITGTTAISNGILYFAAQDNLGYGLWRCDGTPSGSYRVKTLSTNGNSISNLVDGNGTLYFVGDDAESNKGKELWKSDGTEQGTVTVKDIMQGQSGSNPGLLAYASGTFFFDASTAAEGAELWKTDGTASGTKMVKDIDPGPNGSLNISIVDQLNQELFVVANNKLFFRASSAGSGYELWVSDGTSAGTYLVKDIAAGAGSSFPKYMVALNNNVFFEAYDPINGYALWKSDGTEAGTVLVKDINSSSGATEYIKDIVASNGKLLIFANNSSNGMELWVSDGTSSGTMMLKDINPGAAGSELSNLTGIGNVAYFSANDGVHGNEPWITDGTMVGTHMLADITPGSAGTGGGDFAKAGNKVAFGVLISIAGDTKSSIWITDGTASGTTMAYQDCCNPATASSITYNGNAYFVSFTGNLLVSDGTMTGTLYFPFDPVQTNSSIPHNAGDSFKMIKFNDHEYILLADDGIHGNDPWITDGTPGGTYLLKDFQEDVDAYYLFSKPVNGKIFISVRNYAADDGLWVTDGTSDGTIHLSDSITAAITDCAILNGILYFPGEETGSYVFNLYRSDGTIDGTYPVVTSNPSVIGWLATYNNEIYFSGSDINHGSELWKSDGTASGTVRVKDINPGTSGSEPQYLIPFNNKLYFQSLGNTADRELWASDGTEAGTYLVKDINPAASSYPYGFTVSGNTLFFSADTKSTGYELYKTDGTSEGTIMIKDIRPGKKDGVLQDYGYLTDVNGTLFFAANDSVHGAELWKSDGTEAGTVMVKDISPGKKTSQLSQFRNVNGDLYFIITINEGIDGSVANLWRSNGTDCGTQQVDLNVTGSALVSTLTSDENNLFFYLLTDAYGDEPWRYSVSPITTYEICNGIDDDCNGIVDDNALTASITPSGSIEACQNEPVTLNASPTGNDLSYAWYWNGNLINNVTTSSLSSSTLGGDVQVVISSSFGCVDTSAITSVERISPPAAKITPQGSLDICSTGFVKLKANNGNGYSYQWLLDNAEIFGATGKTYNATQPGNYKVEVTNVNGCSKTSKKVTVVTSCKENDSESIAGNYVNAYPNPFHQTITLDLSSFNFTNEPVQILITDLSGKILFNKTFSYQEEIEIGNDLPAGFYLIEVKGINFHQVLPVIKE